MEPHLMIMNEVDTVLATEYLPVYEEYRKLYPLKHSTNHLFTFVYSVTEEVKLAINTAFCIAFSRGMAISQHGANAAASGRLIFLSMAELIPDVITTFLPDRELNKDEYTEMVVANMSSFLTMVNVETEQQNKYIADCLGRVAAKRTDYVDERWEGYLILMVRTMYIEGMKLQDESLIERERIVTN